ncbi:CPBP family intramembrane glutamic endopeptidase [Halovenus halobia]|uniref:CPBP family intramembrane glutamic endopeptidase n=1 Tax=Halovenus halobia TaxID=3396622 RepID=UPI003F576E80
MAQPVPFLLVAATLTLGLLVLARQSADLLQSGSESVADTDNPAKTESEAVAQSSNAVIEQPIEGVAQQRAVPNEVTDLSPREEPTINSPTHPRDAEIRDPDPPQEIELTPAMVIANVAATQGLMAGVIIAAGLYFAIPIDAVGVTAAPLSTGLLGVGVGVGFGVLLWAGNELATNLADAVGAAYDEGVREMLAPTSAGGWVLLFGVVLPLIAIAEELLFRAALIGVPATFFGVSPWLLAVVASLAFALGHGAQGRVGVVVTGLLGFVLAGGYILTGSLLVVVVAHYVVNAMEFFVHEYLGLDL